MTPTDKYTECAREIHRKLYHECNKAHPHPHRPCKCSLCGVIFGVIFDDVPCPIKIARALEQAALEGRIEAVGCVSETTLKQWQSRLAELMEGK